jgi:hypothetical protein
LRSLLAAAALIAALACSAQAEAQQFGGCFLQGRACAGPSATISVGVYNATTGKFSGGVVPGLGYGITYAPDQWYAAGLAAYFSFQVGQGQPNQAVPSLMLSFANYIRVGLGVRITERQEPAPPDAPPGTQWLVFFGLGSDFGGSPKYIRDGGQR